MSNELLTFLLDHEDFRKARLPSLYSDFTTLRTSNPDGFTANVSAWKNVLSSASLNGMISDSSDRLVLTVDPNLMRDLATREWGMPSALPTVVNECVAKRDFIPRRLFLESERSVYYTRLIDPWNVVSWGLQKSGLSDLWSGIVGTGDRSNNNKMVAEKYVVLSNVEKIANSVLKTMSKRNGKVDKIFTLETFLEQVDSLAETTLSKDDVKVLLKYLTRDVHEASMDKPVVAGNENAAVIKFKTPNEANITPVTEEDVAVARLKSLINRLNSEVEELSSKMATHQQKAKTAVAAHNEKLARHALVMKTLAKGAMETKLDRLSQLESLLQKLEQASDNAEIVKTLEDSSRVLEKMNKDVGGVEKVEKLLDELHDHMYKTEEITNLLNEPGDMSLDPQDLEDEFELMKEQEEEARRKEDEAEKEKSKQKKQQEEADKLAEILGNVSLTADSGTVEPKEGEKVAKNTTTATTADEQSGEQKEEEESSKPKNKENALLAS